MIVQEVHAIDEKLEVTLLFDVLRAFCLELPAMVIFLHVDRKRILYLLFHDHLTSLSLIISLDLDHSSFETIVVANFDISHLFSFALLKINDLENALLHLLTKIVSISEPEYAF